MDHFNNKFYRLKKELVDINLNLNKFKSENHLTLTRIIDNLSTIPKNSNIQTINKNSIEKLDYHKTNIPNNNRKKLFYTKKPISLEKNSQYPFYDDKINLGKICSSTTNLNYRNHNKNQKRSNTDNLNINNNKEKIYFKNNDKISLLKEKNEDNFLYGKLNNLQIDTSSAYKTSKYEDESTDSIINLKERMKRLNKYKEINDKFLLEKENQNINSDYNFNNIIKKKNEKDNIVNISSYNHHYNSNINNNLNFNYISKFTNDIDKNYINDDYLISNINKDNLEQSLERIDLNNIGYNYSINLNNKIINNLNNISPKVKTNMLYKIKDTNIYDNNFRNSQKINTLKEKFLINKNNDYRKNINYIKDDTIKTKNDNNNNFDKENKMQVFKNLGVNNIEEAKIKITKLKYYQKFYDQIKEIFLGYNRENKNYKSNNILLWIYGITNKYYSSSNYRSFLEDIMKENDIKSFEEFKIIINDYINNQ